MISKLSSGTPVDTSDLSSLMNALQINGDIQDEITKDIQQDGVLNKTSLSILTQAYGQYYLENITNLLSSIFEVGQFYL